MLQLQYTLHVNVSPERAWAVVGDLAGVSTWIPGIVSSTVEGVRAFLH
jgi:carbon monoxide dehydrogenase subunit G